MQQVSYYTVIDIVALATVSFGWVFVFFFWNSRWGIKLSIPERINSQIRAAVLEAVYLKKAERRASAI